MRLKNMWENRQKHSLIENTIMLYILQFSTMALGFFTQGFQVRVLGMEKVGVLGTAAYAGNFFQMLIDFGFILSATAKIAQHREDKAYLSKTLSCVVAAKTLFMLVCAVIMAVFVAPVLDSRDELAVYLFYLASVCLASFLPDFMYRGLEQMTTITVRAVSIKIFAAVMIFVFIRQPSDYYLVPLFTALGNGAALIFVYRHLFHKVGVRFCRVTVREVWAEIADSSQFFLSKLSASVNTNLSGILVRLNGGDFAAGLYNNADKVINVAKGGMGPIADSLYPHMMKHKNFNIVKKALLYIFPIILLGSGAVYVFAEPLLVLWLGPEGKDVVQPLRLMIPAAVFTFPGYVLGHPTLGAMGLMKYANISVVFGTFVFLLGVGVAYLTVGIGLESLCILASVTEFSVTAFRIAVIAKNRRLLKTPK